MIMRMPTWKLMGNPTLDLEPDSKLNPVAIASTSTRNRVGRKHLSIGNFVTQGMAWRELISQDVELPTSSILADAILS
jgi:hypothetical protein